MFRRIDINADTRLAGYHFLLRLAAVFALTAGAHAQTPSDYAPVTLNVACGEVFRAPCARVLPAIVARIAQSGLVPRPVESGGARDTIDAVCRGQTAAAIVPRDAAVQFTRAPACLGRYDVVGRPLYPLYAFLVMKADIDLAKRGRPATIAAGLPGSGGQITLGLLSQDNPEWQRMTMVTNDDLDAALQRIADGSIDGYFTVDSLDSDLINRVRFRTDSAGKPLYSFIDVRPGTAFLARGDGAGHCLYRLTALDFGGASPVTTISVDAVMILGRAFRDTHARSGPRASDALPLAIDQAQGAILTATKSPQGWRPAATSCQ